MIILDTHTWVWWVSSPKRLSPSAKKIIDHSMENNEIFISSISTWEVAILVDKDRLKLTLEVNDWIARSERLPFVTFISIDNTIALKSVFLPGDFHSDPADRIIVATAITTGAPLVTKDERILSYPYVETVW
jgi:PIN domain nuclease of toxin-antitoxin system